MNRKQIEYLDKVKDKLLPPLFRNLITFGLTDGEKEYILSSLFGETVEVNYYEEQIKSIYGYELYSEVDGFWSVSVKTPLGKLWQETMTGEKILRDGFIYTNIYVGYQG